MNFRILAIGLLLSAAGCAQRSVYIESQPTGALVYINGNEVGRTPMKYDFDLYGNFDVILRKEGFTTLKTAQMIPTPLHGYPPLDLIGELFGARDRYDWMFTLQPVEAAGVDARLLIENGLELEGQLHSSEFTRVPATQPSSRPARAATRPASLANGSQNPAPGP
jgi:hypothetical protein